MNAVMYKRIPKGLELLSKNLNSSFSKAKGDILEYVAQFQRAEGISVWRRRIYTKRTEAQALATLMCMPLPT